MSENTSSNGGVGLAGLLLVLFVGLKLTGYIAWSWWWVVSPVWIPIVLILVIAALTGIVALISMIYKHFAKKG